MNLQGTTHNDTVQVVERSNAPQPRVEPVIAVADYLHNAALGQRWSAEAVDDTNGDGLGVDGAAGSDWHAEVLSLSVDL